MTNHNITQYHTACILTSHMPCTGPKATLVRQARRPTTAFVRQHDNSSAGISGATTDPLSSLSYLGLATSRVLRVPVQVPQIAPGAVPFVGKHANPLLLIPHMKKVLVKQLHKVRANLSEKTRHSHEEEERKLREIKTRLMETVDSSISITHVKECKDMIKNMYQTFNENVQQEGEVFAMDSDDEMALYEELDAMTEAVERAEEANQSWELVAAKNFNQAALNVSGLEDSYHILYNLLCSTTEHAENVRKGHNKSEEVMLTMEHVAQAVAQLGANISSLYVYMYVCMYACKNMCKSVFKYACIVNL